jgi:hypothetical protein
MLFVRAYPRETQEMVFDAHDRAFALFKGTCSRGIYDNYGRLPRKATCWIDGVGCTNLSGLWRSDRAPGFDGSPQSDAS